MYRVGTYYKNLDTQFVRNGGLVVAFATIFA